MTVYMKLRNFTIICVFSLVLLARWMLSLKIFPFYLKVYVYFLCVCMCMCVHSSAIVHTLSSENNFWELIFFFNCMGTRDQTQVIEIGGKHLNPLDHLTGPYFNFF